MDTLTFRQGYFGDPSAWTAFASLLQDIFEFDVTPLERLGGPDRTCMPFAYFDKSGVCVANLSAFSIPLMIGGRHVKGAGIQSGAVRPHWRGKGLYRDLLTRALSWCDQQGFELVALYTDEPKLYHAHGFRVVPEQMFVGSPPAYAKGSAKSRALSAHDADDITLIRRLLGSRVPVSRQVAVINQSTMFLLNVSLDAELQLAYLEDETAVVVFQHGAEGCFRLVDVVGSVIPPLATILEKLGTDPTRIEVSFQPDRLDWVGQPTPANREVSLMFKGKLPASLRQPFMLPPTTAF